MKKTIIITLLLLLVFIIAAVLAACGNKSVVTPVDYNIAIVFMKNGARTYEIESWAEAGSNRLQLNLKDGGTMLVDSVNCILYKGDIREIPHY